MGIRDIAKAGVLVTAGWGLTKLLLSSTSEEEDKQKNNKGDTAEGEWVLVVVAVVVVALVGWGLLELVSSSAASEEYEKTNDKGKLMGYQEFEDSHSDSEDEDRDEAWPFDYIPECATSTKPSSWRFPGHGKLKMNTDGSVKWCLKQKDGSVRYINPPRAGFGGVIRDEGGSLIVGFYGRLKDGCEVLEAELWGIYKGLEIIRDRNLREVVEIESDSQAAVYLIENETAYRRSRFKELAEKCKAMKLEMGCTLEHALREGNRVADKLAKQGRDQYNDFITFTTAPSRKIANCLLADFKLANSFVADAA